MKKFFITGTSSGIGKALAQAALEDGHLVVGFSRRSALQHPRYKHVRIDLAQLENYVSIQFENAPGVDELILVNNAGTLGQVKPVAGLSPDRVAEAYSLNITAPSVLSKLFVQHTEKMPVQRTIINISSGAGSYPVKSWSVYCASKAALDMFTEVLKLDHPELRCHSVAPGIVDTEMQGEIRRQPAQNFPDLQRFIDYKKQGELASAKEVAQKLLYLIAHPSEFKDTKLSLRGIDL